MRRIVNCVLFAVVSFPVFAQGVKTEKTVKPQKPVADHAHNTARVPEHVTIEKQNPEKSLWDSMHIHSWAEFSLCSLNYPPYSYQDDLKKYQKDLRLLVDVEEFNLEVTHELDTDWGYHWKLLVQHGGMSVESLPNYLGSFAEPHDTHSTPGSFEFNELYIYKKYGQNVLLKLGRVPVAFGLSSSVNPLNYLAPFPFEAESNMVPPHWTEHGVSVRLKLGVLESITQGVTGLDSTGFNSRRFVAQSQQRFGSRNFTSPGYVERLDLKLSKFTIGGSIYYTNVSRNRPSYDMANVCPNSDGSNVAPCGYVYSPLIIYEGHMTLEDYHWILSAMYMSGYISNAGEINTANNLNTTNLPDYYFPVAKRATGYMGELGYKFYFNNRLSQIYPFLRYEKYNTMLTVVGVNDGGPQFDRTILELGAGYIGQKFYAKGSVQFRKFGSSAIPTNRSGLVTTGYIF